MKRISLILASFVSAALFVLTPAAAQTLPSKALIINEIHYAPAVADQEFIEVVNLSGRVLNLCDYSISDNRDVKVDVCIGNYEVQPEVYVVIARDSLAMDLAFPGLRGAIVYPDSWPALNNGGDASKIFSGDTLIDEVVFFPSWGGLGVSLERIDPAGPSNASFNWGSSKAGQKATPLAQNSIYAPDKTPPALLLAEVSAPNTLTLIWNEPLNLKTLHPSNFTITHLAPDSVAAISPVQTILQFNSVINEDHVTFRDVQDLTGNKSPELSHPLAFIPANEDLLINEIMYAPLADAFDHLPDQPEYVELYNVSGRLLSLRTLSLTGKPDENNQVDTLRSYIPFPVVYPLSYVVLFAAQESALTPAQGLSEAFPSINFSADTVVLLPVSGSALGLLNTGDIITISSKNHQLIDEVSYSPDWHHPLLAETRGIALERRTPLAPSTAHNWTSATNLYGGTPGEQNSVNLPSHENLLPGQLQLKRATFSPDQDGFEDELSISFVPENAPEVIDIQIFDVNGRLVRSLVAAAFVSREEIFVWDGLDDDGHLLPVGIYIIAVNVLDVLVGKAKLFKKPAVLALSLK